MNRWSHHRELRLADKALAALAVVLWLSAPHVLAQEMDMLSGKPIVGRNADGQLQIFEVDGNGELRQRWQRKSDGDWSSWSSLGGCFLPGIAVANGADGRLQIFAVNRTNHMLECICQRATNSIDWSDWQSLGGSVLPPVAAAQNADGRLEVFAVATAGAVGKHIWQTGPNGGWSKWANLGGALQPALVVARNNDGRLEVFGLEAGGHALVHCWQQQANDSQNWSRWASLGGSVLPGFAIGQNAVGRLEVFAVNGTNDAVVRCLQTTAGDSLRWGPWQKFGAEPTTNAPAAKRDFTVDGRGFGDNVDPGLVVGKSGDGRLEVFAVDVKTGQLLHRWETLINGSDVWSQWACMGATALAYPAVGANEDGDLEVFAVDPSNREIIRHRRQISSASDWLDWCSLDYRTFQYHCRTWQSDEGLPDNLVQAITQTTDGFLWVGTRDGLARFDGSQFFCYDGRNTPALRNSSVTALCADHSGGLWIGTDGGGLVRLKDGVFSRFETTTGLAGNAVRVIYEGRDGSVWIGTTTGMSRWQNGHFHNYSQRDGLLSEVVRSIYEDREANLWIATGKGLNRLRPNGTMDAFDMPNGLPNDSVRVICEDRGGRIWIGSNNGLLWYNWFWGNAFYAYNTKYGLSDFFVSTICEDAEGSLWVGTYSGLNRFREGRFYSQPDENGQPFGKVNATYVDREGDLWVGSQEGLSRLTPQKLITYTKQQGLSHNNVMSVMQDRSGILWMGTWGGGLDKLQNERVTACPLTDGLSQDLILSLCEGRDGSLWVGADFDGGLTQIRAGTKRHYTWQEGLPNAGLRVLHEDAAGILWIGTDRGLSCFANGKFPTNAATIRLAGISVRDIAEDKSGALWFATQQGLGAWRDGQFSLITATNALGDSGLTALYVDDGNTLWIGTGAAGLIRCRNGEFTGYSTRQGLFSDEIFGVLGDDQGWLWMTCSKGIFRVRKTDFDAFDHGKLENLPSLVYDKSDSLESLQCNGAGKPSIWKSRDGQLWFPTSKGLVTVDPATLKMDEEPPAVFIETVTADQRTVADGRTNLSGATSVLARSTAPLRIGPGHGELEFQYTALGFSAPEKEHFKYRLEGVDTAWVDAHMRRVAYYNGLGPGTYRFQVRACNKDGVWNDAGATLAVILLPHYWQTLWFRASLTTLIIGVACGSILYGARRRMQRRLAVLERQQAVEKERGRIAKDMHDQLGAGLTQIGLLGEFARREAGEKGHAREHAEKITGLARELAQTLDEIVWAVNPRNDTLNKLGAYLAAYAENFFQGTSIRCRLDIPPGLPAYPISAEFRHNLFLTVKEALNNLVKHSRATQAHLELFLAEGSLELVIQDNGAGFVARNGSSSRNGLSNMSERIEAIGGRAEISSEPG
ncbi:MAG TPA: two-component regulator propeller domain-containing protein, partial [Candidatus Acidoferrales bacterium]|nr:two-component regulator propeller domain-containing protein [Candidatus Acidoferrales bacterium]